MNLVTLHEDELRALRWRDYSVVMQSAMNALNPTMSIAAQFRDAMRAHSSMSDAEIRDRSAEVLRLVGIDEVHLASYPHQLSGGMRQRAMIAMALLFTPDLVIMDEPTSALDVVAQRSLMTPDQGAPAAPRVRRDLRDPRHVAGEPLLGPPGGHVRGPAGRGGRRPSRSSRTRSIPYSRGPAGRLPVHSRPAPRPHRDPGQPAGPRPSAGRMPLPAPLPGGDGGLRARRGRIWVQVGRLAGPVLCSIPPRSRRRSDR